MGDYTELPHDQFFTRYEKQIKAYKKGPELNDVIAPELASYMYAEKNAEFLQEYLEKLLQLNKTLQQNVCKMSDSDTKNEDIVTYFTTFLPYLMAEYFKIDSNKKKKVFVKLIQDDLKYYASECTQKGTVGGAISEQFLSTLSSFYEAFQDKGFTQGMVEPLKLVAANSKGKLSKETKQYMGTITQYMNMSQPGIMKEHTAEFYLIGINSEIWDLVKSAGQGNPKSLIPHIESTYDVFIDAFENEMNKDAQLHQFLDVISEEYPQLLIKNVDICFDLCDSIYKYYGMKCCANLAKKFPDKIFEKEKLFAGILQDDKTTGYFACDIFGQIGANTVNKDTINSCVKYILDVLNNPDQSKIDQTWAFMCGNALKAIAHGGEIQKEVLKGAPFYDTITMLKASSNSNVKQMAMEIDDILSGRTLENLDAKMEQIRKEIMDYVDKNLDEMKKNYNNKVKTLPMPSGYECKKNVMNKIFLKFHCSIHKENCEYPGPNVEDGEFFKTQTTEVNKWVKIGISVCAIGKSIFMGNAGGAVSELGKIYQAAKSDDSGAEHFKKLVEEPFLTSDESDKLIKQLRAANYFYYFSFDAPSEGWACYTCKPFERKDKQEAGSGCCNTF